MPSAATIPKVVTRTRMVLVPSLPASPPPDLRRSLAYERRAVEGATADPHVALGDPESVADVAGAVAVHVAGVRVGERRHAALPRTHDELRHHERVADVHD